MDDNSKPLRSAAALGPVTQGAAGDGPTPAGVRFPVVGVGASAGGLEAFTELLQNLPPEPGLALLYVQHLEPTRKSQLTEILANVTPLSVREASDGMPVEPDHVYLIPPNTNLALAGTTLALSPRPGGRGPHMPIDHLFRSLAEVQKSRAIAVILSGGGTDGTLGFQAIKAEGGITFAQELKSARHDSMPRSAIVGDSVDYILPPRDIARQLVRVTRHPYARTAGLPDGHTGEGVRQILALLRTATDVDFSHYKRTTVSRRIQRRMALHGLESLDDYLRHLRDDAAEVRNLYQDLLIRVTQFFRDPEAFEALKEKVFPQLVRDRGPDSPVRVWVVGCATGEEVYSLAICLLELLSAGGREQVPVKILATDVNETALERARAGVYVDNIELDVNPERLRRFFVRSDGQYKVCKAVRELCIFSRHNLASDPPFSRIDLVSCRNVLIYMDLTLQKRAIPVFHYALNPDGFLFLGASENIGGFTELFAPVDARARVFARCPASTGLTLDFSTYLTPTEGRGASARPHGSPPWSALDMQKEADRIVQARYAPVGVIVDEAMTVLQFRGRTRDYLEPAPGTASLDLLKMLREGLLAEVRSAINQSRAENVAVTREGIRVKEGEWFRLVKVEVIPFKVPPSEVRCFLVMFQDLPSRGPTPPAPGPDTPGSRPANGEPRQGEGGPPVASLERQVAQLQEELAALREYLQSIIEEHEATNEELKSASEEILSSNEELQSTNEELQTAKEEAQSAYEELATVNEELHHRNQELGEANNDLLNLLSGVNIPIVMISRELRIRRFTPLAEKVFNLIPGDVGRPISDLKPNLQVADLSASIATVIDTLTPYESEVQDRGGHWYSLRIRPYITQDNKIDGASIVLVDVDSVKRLPEEARHSGG